MDTKIKKSDLEELMTTEEVAKYLHLSLYSFSKKISKKIPRVKIGTGFFYYPSDVKNYLTSIKISAE